MDEKILDPETVEMVQFLDPEIVEMVQFLDPEILEKVDKSFMPHCSNFCFWLCNNKSILAYT